VLKSCSLIYGQMERAAGCRLRVGSQGSRSAEYFRDMEGRTSWCSSTTSPLQPGGLEVSALLAACRRPWGISRRWRRKWASWQERITSTKKGSDHVGAGRSYVPADGPDRVGTGDGVLPPRRDVRAVPPDLRAGHLPGDGSPGVVVALLDAAVISRAHYQVAVEVQADSAALQDPRHQSRSSGMDELSRSDKLLVGRARGCSASCRSRSSVATSSRASRGVRKLRRRISSFERVVAGEFDQTSSSRRSTWFGDR